MELASPYLARLGPKGIVTVLVESNTARNSVFTSKDLMLRWYYEAQAVMNVCASTLQSPASINEMWDEEQRKGKAQAEMNDCASTLQLSESINKVWDYTRDSGMPRAALGIRTED
jgi:hypothetical protein